MGQATVNFDIGSRRQPHLRPPPGDHGRHAGRLAVSPVQAGPPRLRRRTGRRTAGAGGGTTSRLSAHTRAPVPTGAAVGITRRLLPAGHRMERWPSARLQLRFHRPRSGPVPGILHPSQLGLRPVLAHPRPPPAGHERPALPDHKWCGHCRGAQPVADRLPGVLHRAVPTARAARDRHSRVRKRHRRPAGLRQASGRRGVEAHRKHDFSARPDRPT